jgi:1-acyl-sn-glycerol-3-phosphate acyltransferase
MTLLRRLVAVTLVASLCLLTVLGLPLLLPLAAAADLLRRTRRWPTVRCLLFVTIYLLCEAVGVAVSALLWLVAGWRGAGTGTTPAARLTGYSDAYLAANFRLQRWWARTLYRGAERVFDMHTVVEGDAAVRRGPFLLLSRHASIGDTVIPAVYISDRHGVMLRFVMKRELLWDPCLDIVGNRLPNHFIQRGAGESQREIAALQRLMEHLGGDDGVLIFPEGTRFSPAKRDRAVARLQGVVTPRLLAMAARLRHTLPPRLGGTLGLLEHNPGVDVVLCAHTGFEGAATFRDLLAGSLIGREVRVAFWRVPFADIPRDAPARAEWLYAQWLRIDAWIDGGRADLDMAQPSVAVSR